MKKQHYALRRRGPAFLALMLCVALCAAMAFSHAFIALETEHECTAEHCKTCAALQSCHALIRELSHAGAAISVIACIAYLLAVLHTYFSKTVQATTLVSLKVKLLN